MNDKKYELTDETYEMNGRTLHRIRALKTFTNKCNGSIINKGDLGGYVERETNLSQEGTAWVGGDAMAFEDSRVDGDALVCGTATICGAALIANQAHIYGTASVEGSCVVLDNAQVGGYVVLDGNVNVLGDAYIFHRYDSSIFLYIGGNRCICGDACIWGEKDMLSLPELKLTAWQTTDLLDCVEIAEDVTGYTCTLTEFKESPKFKEKYGDLMQPIVDLIETYFKKAISLSKLINPTKTKVRWLIEESGLTVRQIAEKSGVKRGTINSWLYTSRQPRPQNYEKVMAVLNNSKGETNND